MNERKPHINMGAVARIGVSAAAVLGGFALGKTIDSQIENNEIQKLKGKAAEVSNVEKAKESKVVTREPWNWTSSAETQQPPKMPLKRDGFEITIPSYWVSSEKIFSLVAEDKRGSEAWINVLPLKFVGQAMSPREYFKTKYPGVPNLESQLKDDSLAGWNGLRWSYQVGEGNVDIYVLTKDDELREVSVTQVGDNPKTRQDVQRILQEGIRFTTIPIPSLIRK